MSEKKFFLKPRYLDEFKCDGGLCGAMCCRSDWTIFVDAKTREKYSALPAERAEKIFRHLQADPSGEKFFIVRGENCCPFLGADNLCEIQKACGEDYLSRVCAGYPRIITRIENFLEVALSPSCPVAAKVVLLKREPLTFDVTEPDEKILRLGENNILQGIPHDFAPLLIKIQLTMTKILQTRKFSIEQRLIVLGFFLDRVEEILSGSALNDATLKKLSAVYTSEKFLAAEVPLMLRSVGFSVKEKNLPEEFFLLAENFLVNEIFLGAWPLRLDTSFANNFGVFAVVYKIFEQRCLGLESVEEILSVAGDVSRMIDHDGDCLKKISASIEGDDMFSLMEKIFLNWRLTDA